MNQLTGAGLGVGVGAAGAAGTGAGAGIGADSIPEQEWQETLDKAGFLRSVATSRAVASVYTACRASAQEHSA